MFLPLRIADLRIRMIFGRLGPQAEPFLEIPLVLMIRNVIISQSTELQYSSESILNFPPKGSEGPMCLARYRCLLRQTISLVSPKDKTGNELMFSF